MILNNHWAHELASEYWSRCNTDGEDIFASCEWCGKGVPKGKGCIVNREMNVLIGGEEVLDNLCPDIICEWCALNKSGKAWDASGKAETLEEARIALQEYFKTLFGE